MEIVPPRYCRERALRTVEPGLGDACSGKTKIENFGRILLAFSSVTIFCDQKLKLFLDLKDEDTFAPLR